jgi:two-component system cell cycle response regulator DivK
MLVKILFDGFVKDFYFRMISEKKTILVVEDEEETAELFSEMLKVSGFQVISSSQSQKAIDMVKEKPPNGIVLDIMLADISGLEVLRFVRQDPQLSQIPVVVVSAKGLPSDIKTAIEAGATAYLTKPVSYLDLTQTIEKALLE